MTSKKHLTLDPHDPRRTARGLLGLIDEDPTQFEGLLLYVVAASLSLPPEDTPPMLLRARVLEGLRFTTSVADVGQFLTDWPNEFGAYARDAIDWCEEIGAPRAAELLRRAIALLPNGRVATGHVDRMCDVNAVRKRAPGDPFKTLKLEFADGIAEIRPRLLAFLLAHRVAVLRDLADVDRLIAHRDSPAGWLEITDNLKFIDALDEAVKRVYPGERVGIGASVYPPARRMTVWLRRAWLHGTNGGAYKLVAAHRPDESWDEVRRWCCAIGADRLADFLAAVERAFPDARIPSDDDRRLAALAALDALEDQPLRRIDAEHDGALEDMVDALRDFVAARSGNPVDALDHLVRGDTLAPVKRTRRKNRSS